MALKQDVGSFPMVYGRKNLFSHSMGIIPEVFVHELHGNVAQTQWEHFPLLTHLKLYSNNMRIKWASRLPELREMFPQSLGFIPKEFVNEYHGNDFLGFSSRGWWETIPCLAITPSWLRPICEKNKLKSSFRIFKKAFLIRRFIYFFSTS